jgi:hypothetical protein
LLVATHSAPLLWEGFKLCTPEQQTHNKQHFSQSRKEIAVSCQPTLTIETSPKRPSVFDMSLDELMSKQKVCANPSMCVCMQGSSFSRIMTIQRTHGSLLVPELVNFLVTRLIECGGLTSEGIFRLSIASTELQVRVECARSFSLNNLWPTIRATSPNSSWERVLWTARIPTFTLCCASISFAICPHRCALTLMRAW